MSKKKKKSRNINSSENITQSREDKKAAVLGTAKKDNGANTIIIIIAAVIAVGSIIYFIKGDNSSKYIESPKATNIQTNTQNTNQNTNIRKEVSQNTSSEVISYDKSMFADGKAKYFQYRDGNILIKYFILKSSDGIIRVAFDACDVCWRAGKGYTQEGDEMVCRNCGQRFPSVKINEIKGGCNPAPVNREIVGNKLIIKVSDIRTGKQYFSPGRS